MTELRHFITPEFEPHRLGHSKAVHVEDSAPHAELCDVVDHRYALEPNRLEMTREVLGPAGVSFPELEPRMCQRTRQLCLLENRARGREKDLHLSAPDAFQSLDALTGDFRM